MPKIAFGEKTAELVTRVIEANQDPVRTSTDYAALANEEMAIQFGPDRANLTSTAINSFLSYHPDGQRLAVEGKVARERGKMAPQWANGRTPVAESQTKKAGQLVQYTQHTGLRMIDSMNEQATRALARIAKSLPNGRQRDVVAVADALNGAAEMINLHQDTIGILRAQHDQTLLPSQAMGELHRIGGDAALH